LRKREQILNEQNVNTPYKFTLGQNSKFSCHIKIIRKNMKTVLKIFGQKLCRTNTQYYTHGRITARQHHLKVYLFTLGPVRKLR
jgi:hypothetical protein